jgi:hypothetical protein
VFSELFFFPHTAAVKQVQARVLEIRVKQMELMMIVKQAQQVCWLDTFGGGGGSLPEPVFCISGVCSSRHRGSSFAAET